MLHIWTTKYCISTYSCVKEGQYCERLAARVSGILAPRVDPFLNALTVVFLFVFLIKFFFEPSDVRHTRRSVGHSPPPPLLLLPPPPPTGPGWEDVVRRWLPESPICSEVDTTERGGVQPELSRGFLLPPPSSAGPREVKGQLVRVKLLLRLPVVLV